MKYAIIESGGKQYRAVEGGTIEVDRLPVEPGVKVKIDQVLLLADGENISVGAPIVKDNPVWTKVMEHFKGEKVTIFNYSPKKRIRVKTGHRQNYTRLLVEQIGGLEFVAQEPAPKVAKAKRVQAAPVKAEAKKPATKAAPAKSESKSPAAKTTKAAAAKTTPAKAAPAKTAPAKAAPAKPAAKKPAAKAAPAKAAPKTSTKKPASTKKPSEK
jgi:large subunit ribosomal protein L21